jgi:hypothetical protein
VMTAIGFLGSMSTSILFAAGSSSESPESPSESESFSSS